jgi:hypothetical protein
MAVKISDNEFLCECGCGERTRLAPQSSSRLGWVKGRPLRFINGHNREGKRSGPTHPAWSGDDITHSGIHRWIRDHYPKTGHCERCGAAGATHYASINGHVYTRNREDYSELCISCHRKHDWDEGRMTPRGPDTRPRKRGRHASQQS